MSEQSAFRVDDMTCGHCESTIRKALAERLPESQVDIDLKSHIVRVGGDAEAARQAIETAGYTPQPA
ncbi:MAG: heavy-metal-associated domain-containing protein [Tranquillimonas sp.]|jgi:copper chaperone